MSENLCIRCSRPTPDGYGCSSCAQELADVLATGAGHAEDAEAVIARQARYGGGSRGGSSDGLTYDARRSERYAAVKLAVDGWVSVLLAGEPFPAWQRVAGPLCPPQRTGVRCPHSSCAAIRVTIPPSTLAREFQWLSGQMSGLRMHPAAGEAFRELHDACDELARLVDVPADKELGGMCDCGRTLYAPHGRTVVQCPVPTCKRDWHVERSRDILRKALDEKLVTASEAARLSGFLDSDRTQVQIRKLINKWAERKQLTAHGEIHEEPDDAALAADPQAQPKLVPAFRFGDVFERLARTPRRTPRTGATAC